MILFNIKSRFIISSILTLAAVSCGKEGGGSGTPSSSSSTAVNAPKKGGDPASPEVASPVTHVVSIEPSANIPDTSVETPAESCEWRGQVIPSKGREIEGRSLLSTTEAGFYDLRKVSIDGVFLDSDGKKIILRTETRIASSVTVKNSISKKVNQSVICKSWQGKVSFDLNGYAPERFSLQQGFSRTGRFIRFSGQELSKQGAEPEKSVMMMIVSQVPRSSRGSSKQSRKFYKISETQFEVHILTEFSPESATAPSVQGVLIQKRIIQTYQLRIKSPLVIQPPAR